MSCDRDEASRAKELAEKKFAEKDLVGAKRFALKAQNLYSKLDGLHQFLATLDVHISFGEKINGVVNWYGVLGVETLADDNTIRKQYKKLALILHPDKNKSVGAEGAFQIICEAYALLSDKNKRIIYDLERLGKFGEALIYKSSASMPTGENHFHNVGSNSNFNAWDQSNHFFRSPTPDIPSKPPTFWTACSACGSHFEHLRIYLNCNLLCSKCQLPFLAIETNPPYLYDHSFFTPWSGYMQQRNFGQTTMDENSYSVGRNPASSTFARAAEYSGIDPLMKTFQTDAFFKTSGQTPVDENSYSHRRNPSSATFGRPAGFSHIDPLMKTFQTDAFLKTSGQTTVDENSYPLGRKPASATFGRPTRSSGFGLLKRIFQTDASLTSGSTRSAPPEPSLLAGYVVMEPQPSCGNLKRARETVEIFSARENACQMKTHKSARASSSSIPKGDRLKKRRCKDEQTKSMGMGIISISVMDPDFHDFDQDRTEMSFGKNQVWAAFDNDDGMPRYYAMIRRVISVRPFKMLISWLSSKTNNELAPINWIDSGFAKTSGDFLSGEYQVYNSPNYFSHKVRWVKGSTGAIHIYPKKGDVWALYTNWSDDWNERTPDEVIHKYDMVEVIEDFNKATGVAVVPLVKVPGFKGVFHRSLEQGQTNIILRKEMFRFSHQVPFYSLTGQEGTNTPKGCLELDPASTPLELLQVQPEEMKIASKAKVEYPLEGVKTLKGDETGIAKGVHKNIEAEATMKEKKIGKGNMPIYE